MDTQAADPDASDQDDGSRVFTIAAELFGLLSSPVRLKIVCALLEGERSVGQLLDQVQATQPNLSQHLSTLYRSGVLARRRDGAQLRYRIASDRVRVLCQTVLDQTAAPPTRP